MKQILALLVLAALAGCAADTGGSDTGGDNNVSALEVTGTWTSNFDTEEVITNDSWSFMEVTSFDNKANEAITQNAADDMYNPDKFNRLVWTDMAGDTFYYCTAAFGKNTAAEAAADTTAVDASDPDNSGCGGFGWTKLTRK